MAEENEVIENNPFIINNGSDDDTANSNNAPVAVDENNPFVVSEGTSNDTSGDNTSTGDGDNTPASPFASLDKAHDAGLMGWGNYKLPDPEWTMYDDIEDTGLLDASGYAQAMRRYQMYLNHPDSTRGVDGRLIYNNKVVPQPETSLFGGGYDPGLGQTMGAGIRNMVGNVAELAGAGIDAGRDFMQENVGQMFWFDENGRFNPDWKNPEEIAGLSDEDFQNASLFGGRTPFTEAAQENIAKAVPGDSISDALIMEGTAMMVPGTAALKLVQWGGRGRNLARFLAFEAGAVSGASSDGGSLFVGQNAMFGGLQDVFPLLKGVEAEPGSEEYNRVLANRANILMDAMAVGKTLETGVQGLSWGVRFAWSITGADALSKLGRPSAREDALAREILNKLTGVTDDPATMEAARQQIIQLVQDNKDVFLEMPDGLADDIMYTADTMSAIERAIDAGDFEGAQELILRAQGVRRGVTNSGNAPQTTIAQGQPQRALDDTTTQMEGNLGGANAINQSSDQIATSGIDEVNVADAVVGNVEQRIAQLDESLNTLIREDAGLISKVTELERTTGIDITAGANQAADSLRGRLTEASRIMDARKNELFSAVRGGGVDVDDMITTLQSLQPGQLDIAASALPGDALFGRLLREIQPKMIEGPDGNMVRETEEAMRERVTAWASENNLDFATLFTDVRVSLSDTIGRMTGQNASAAERGAAQTLIRFKNWIDEDAITYLRDTGDTETVEAAETAMSYFKNDWAKYWDDGSVLESVGRLRRETIGRGENFQSPRYLDESRNIVTDSLNNRNREVIGNMITLLERPEAGQSASDVVDYIIGDSLTTLANRLDDPSQLGNVNIADIRGTLTEYASILRNNFPEDAAKLDNLIETLRTARGDRTALEAELKAAQDAAQAAADRIYTRELDSFFSSAGIPNVNGYESFRSLFGNANALRVTRDADGAITAMEGPLADIITRAQASGNPLVMDGMKAAYSRYVRENFLTATREAGDNRMVSLGALNKSEQELSNILDYGEAVFQDQPLVMTAIRGILDEAGLAQRSRNVKTVGVSSGTAETQEAIAAVNRTVTLTMGVLSRVGARIRSGATGLIQRSFMPDEVAKVMDRLLSDPEYFIEVATRVTNKDGTVNPDSAMLLRQWLIKSGVYSEDNEPSEEEFMVQLMDAEMAYRANRDMFQQTQDALLNPSPPSE